METISFLFRYLSSLWKRKDIFDLCKNGDHKTLKHAILKKRISCADINKTISENRTPLHIACQFGHYEVVKVLCEYFSLTRGYILLKDHNGWNALHYACSGGYISVVKLLIRKYVLEKEDFFVKDIHGRTPLAIACEYPSANQLGTILFIKDVYKLTLSDFKDTDFSENPIWSLLPPTLTNLIFVRVVLGLDESDLLIENKLGIAPLYTICKFGGKEAWDMIDDLYYLRD